MRYTQVVAVYRESRFNWFPMYCWAIQVPAFSESPFPNSATPSDQPYTPSGWWFVYSFLLSLGTHRAAAEGIRTAFLWPLLCFQLDFVTVQRRPGEEVGSGWAFCWEAFSGLWFLIWLCIMLKICYSLIIWCEGGWSNWDKSLPKLDLGGHRSTALMAAPSEWGSCRKTVTTIGKTPKDPAQPSGPLLLLLPLKLPATQVPA